ncbi:MAG: hydrogenase formation protein HypD [Tannerellaceae bacterium]|jgi:hydrogenase expression/formation protein HypD|nr:hydrogenase formation protein HypD [Tannerellaceae bacterium]
MNGSDYSEKESVLTLSRAIGSITRRTWSIMEVCGGQTHAIAEYALEDMLPPAITLLHGPGCPVCVTPGSVIDHAVGIALNEDIILATFGDMMRVPGSGYDLAAARALGADIRVMYSPLDALALAASDKSKDVVFLAVGFETTLPAHLGALREAIRRGLDNFFLLTSFFAVAPVMDALLSDAPCAVDGFLGAGHVCAVTGLSAYYPMVARYQRPVVVTGFTPSDLLYGIYHLVRLLESGSPAVFNAYKRAVAEEGNPLARLLIGDMLERCDGEWRGLGIIPQSGFKLKESLAAYDARVKYAGYMAKASRTTADNCIAGEIMRGRRQPADCISFGSSCSPAHPLGAPMTSAEGACSARYRYRSNSIH